MTTNVTAPSRAFNALTVPLEPGITLVEASAGTGKTFAITRLVLRLLLERQVDSLSQILVVTFTEKATQELITRIRATLRLAERIFSDTPPAEELHTADLFALRQQHGVAARAIIAKALGELDDLAVSTIHGFCQRVLAESALESRIPFRTQFVEDETEPFQRAARDWARTRLLHDRDVADQIVAGKSPIESWVKQLVIPYRRQPNTQLAFDPNAPAQTLLADFVTQVDRAFEAEKSRRHVLGFDDLLRKVSAVLRNEGDQGPLATRIRARFRAALIDEFQDTDQTQFPIFSNAFAGRPLFLIGDPKQSIYRFRGADIRAYLEAAATVPAHRKYTLLQNFRSTQPYIQAVEALFTRAPDPFLVPESAIDFPRVVAAHTPTPPGDIANDGKQALEWWWLDESAGPNGKTIAKELAKTIFFRRTANEIVRLRGSGVPCKSMAVLVRTNRDARTMKAELDMARVPSVIDGDADVLQSEESEELVRIAAAIASPHNGRAVRSAMATRLWGSAAHDIAALLEGDREAEWNAVSERFAEARELWRTRGVAVAIDELLAPQQTAQRLVVLPSGERRLTNVRHIVELLNEAWALDDIGPGDVGTWMAREQTVPNTPNRRELRLETDSEAVQILTIHKAKGLEFDIVFCPTLWDARARKGDTGPLGINYAVVETPDGAVLDLGTAEIGARQEMVMDDEQAEGLRLAYVALTRAVHRCYVGWGPIGRDKSGNSPLAHLLRPHNALTDGTSEDLAFSDPRAILDALVQRAGGTMGVESLVANEALTTLSATAAPDTPIDAPTLVLGPDQLRTWHVTSFTGITAGDHNHALPHTVEPGAEIDVDMDVAINVNVAPGTLEATLPAGQLAAPQPATGFRSFPAGAHPGVALHDLFERLDFRKATPTETGELVTRVLTQYGLTGSADGSANGSANGNANSDANGNANSDATDNATGDAIDNSDIANQRVRDVSDMLHRVTSATIPTGGFALNAIAPQACLREWRFDLSIGSTSSALLADALNEHGSPHAQAYAPQLRALREQMVAGYLTGVVDLIFEHDGRWWIVDWKSNQLGAYDADYEPARLAGVMHSAHYMLQYHLYMVALHRYLQARLPGYDAAKHWGGVAYVFLRGVNGHDQFGWFTDSVTPELLSALDHALGRRT